MIARAPSTPAYFEQMRAHVDEGGQLSHRNGLDLLAEVERLQEWQKIETSPKDGSHFLARYMLVSDEEDEDGRVIKRGVVEYFTVVAYYVFGGIVEFPWRGGFVQNLTWTHWMPLPAPPAEEPATRHQAFRPREMR